MENLRRVFSEHIEEMFPKIYPPSSVKNANAARVVQTIFNPLDPNLARDLAVDPAPSIRSEMLEAFARLEAK